MSSFVTIHKSPAFHTPSQIYDTLDQPLVEEEWETPYYFIGSNLQVATKDSRRCLSESIKLISLIYKTHKSYHVCQNIPSLKLCYIGCKKNNSALKGQHLQIL